MLQNVYDALKFSYYPEMNRKFLFSIILVLSSVAIAQNKVAVLDLQCDTTIAKAQNLRTLTGVLANEIRRYSKYQVMSSSEVAGLLEHQATRQALGCNDATCYAQIGEALGADLLVVGSVGRISQKSMITLSLVDIAKTETRHSASRTVDGEPGVLVDALPALVSELLGEKIPTDTKGTANAGSVVDTRDGTSFRWVRLGGVVWMAQDIRWKTQQLWTWDSAMTSCPTGWHLPTDEEWDALIQFVDKKNDGEINNNGGYSLKSKAGWEYGGRGSDLYGFKVLPTGYKDSTGMILNAGETAYFWTATSFDPAEARVRILRGGDAYVDMTSWSKAWQAAARCVQD